MRRYKAPGGGALKSAPERKFDGIKLESGPNVPVSPVTQLNICQACYEDEYNRFQTPGAKVWLGPFLHALVPVQILVYLPHVTCC